MIAQTNPQHVDPRDLSRTELDALDLAERFRLYRRRGRYAANVGRSITLVTARRLIGRALARLDHTGRDPRLILTGSGLATLAVHRQRKERRAAGLRGADVIDGGEDA